MAQYVGGVRFPHDRPQRINQIETPDLLKELAPIWLTKPETARRVRQRMRTVFDWSKASGFRSGHNPVEGVGKGLPKQPDRHAQHHAALPYVDVPKFVKSLATSDADEISRLAFEFLILTAARTGEVLGARWDEIDFEDELWTVQPASRRPHGRYDRNERIKYALVWLPIAARRRKSLNAVAA
jgi:integrase